MCKEKYKLLDKSTRGLNPALLGHQPRVKYPEPHTPYMDLEKDLPLLQRSVSLSLWSSHELGVILNRLLSSPLFTISNPHPGKDGGIYTLFRTRCSNISWAIIQTNQCMYKSSDIYTQAFSLLQKLFSRHFHKLRNLFCVSTENSPQSNAKI